MGLPRALSEITCLCLGVADTCVCITHRHVFTRRRIICMCYCRTSCAAIQLIPFALELQGPEHQEIPRSQLPTYFDIQGCLQHRIIDIMTIISIINLHGDSLTGAGHMHACARTSEGCQKFGHTRPLL